MMNGMMKYFLNRRKSTRVAFYVCVLTLVLLYLNYVKIEHLIVSSINGAISIVYILYIPGYVVLNIIQYDAEDLITIILYRIGVSIIITSFFSLVLTYFGIAVPASFLYVFVLVLTLLFVLSSKLMHVLNKTEENLTI